MGHFGVDGEHLPVNSYSRFLSGMILWAKFKISSCCAAFPRKAFKDSNLEDAT